MTLTHCLDQATFDLEQSGVDFGHGLIELNIIYLIPLFRVIAF